MPGLRVYVGSSEDDLRPVTPNDGTAQAISNARFEGRISVYIRYDDTEEHPYFSTPDRATTSWSVQMQGRFLQATSGDSILMGCLFKKALDLPWGTTAAMQFVRLVDPTMEENIAGDSPWILSPLLSGIPHLTHKRIKPELTTANWPTFPASTPIVDGCEKLDAPPHAAARRKHFASSERRASVTLDKGDLLTADLCHDHIRFPSMVLEFPGKITFEVAKVWEEGQRLIVVCCERPEGQDLAQAGPGEIFWCVAFELEL